MYDDRLQINRRLHTDAAGMICCKTQDAAEKAAKMQKEEIDHGKSFI